MSHGQVPTGKHEWKSIKLEPLPRSDLRDGDGHRQCLSHSHHRPSEQRPLSDLLICV